MKIFSNPWMVGLLAAAAVACVAYQTFRPRWQKTPPVAADNQPFALVAQAAASPAPAAPRQAAPAPVSAIDSRYLESHLSKWTDAPRRDPFFPTKLAAVAAPLKPMKLKAVWRQDGVGMVAIDRGIYRLGDAIDGWTISTINDSEVWLESQGEKVRLGFAGLEPANPPKPAGVALE